ncbi:protein KRI1 homolog [Copidosoma floridanum]|uniref:protein KRI1 homolog n=1 Tax=Copidosoma floridanum TaxID=29053 RepID=UPI0006C97EDF|nr:protein KRI1 homolog [Copidosoma floridanum]
MLKLFRENSDEEDDGDVEKLNTDTSYAKNYDNWRKKEELNKLKTKYGEDVALDLMGDDDEDDDESSSSSDDDEGEEIPEEFEKSFYKTLACLKKKDPKIYNENVKFFDNVTISKDESKPKKKKEKPMTLRDYEREIIVKKGGRLSDSEEEDGVHKRPRDPTYVQEQQALKDSFKNALKDEEGEEDDDFLKPKTKSETEQHKEEEAYKEWLKGQSREINEEEQKELKSLRDFWSDPNLDKDEKFLRDYILEKKFLDNDEINADLEYAKVIHDSDENLSEDERNINKQEEFEHKYNFRFEEPDPDFIKRYPRTLEGTLRKKESKRADKRAEVKARKEKEKIHKKEELKQLKALKRKEIEEKLEKLREITGNDDVKLDLKDLEDDFDPLEHDKKMSQLFNDNYYAEDVDEMKPEFPDIDKELGVEKNWDYYDPNSKNIAEYDSYYEGGLHCEDPEFNMDAECDGQKSAHDEGEESVKKKKRRRRSKFAEMIAKEKPKFNPEQFPKAQAYFEQYYALDYEDMIDDLPCRFKYKQVVPNDYGLSIEEILLADDKELNRWCSLKRALQLKDEASEYSDIKRYKQKAANEALKRKYLPSLYKSVEKDEANVNQKEEVEETEVQKSKKKKRRGKRKLDENGEAISEKNTSEKVETVTQDTSEANNKIQNEKTATEIKNSKKKRKYEKTVNKNNEFETPSEKNVPESTMNQLTTEQSVVNGKKTQKKKEMKALLEQVESTNTSEPPQKKKKEQNSEDKSNASSSDKPQAINNVDHTQKKKKKKKKKNSIIQEKCPEQKKLQPSKKFAEKNSKDKGEVLSKKQMRKELFKKKAQKKLEQEEAKKNPILQLNDERFKAYGIKNPKKFKAKLKHANTQK